MYTGILGLSPKVDSMLKSLQATVSDQIELAQGLLELSG